MSKTQIEGVKFTAVQKLRFKQHSDNIKSAFKRGDILKVAADQSKVMHGGLSAIRLSDGKQDMVWPEEVTLA